jgi:hypothetical protein
LRIVATEAIFAKFWENLSKISAGGFPDRLQGVAQKLQLVREAKRKKKVKEINNMHIYMSGEQIEKGRERVSRSRAASGESGAPLSNSACSATNSAHMRVVAQCVGE